MNESDRQSKAMSPFFRRLQRCGLSTEDAQLEMFGASESFVAMEKQLRQAAGWDAACFSYRLLLIESYVTAAVEAQE